MQELQLELVAFRCRDYITVGQAKMAKNMGVGVIYPSLKMTPLDRFSKFFQHLIADIQETYYPFTVCCYLVR